MIRVTTFLCIAIWVCRRLMNCLLMIEEIPVIIWNWHLRLERNIQDVIAACDYVKGRKHSDKTMYISLDEYNAVDIGPEADDFLKECDPWEVGPCTRRTGISMRTTLLFGLVCLQFCVIRIGPDCLSVYSD